MKHPESNFGARKHFDGSISDQFRPVYGHSSHATCTAAKKLIYNNPPTYRGFSDRLWLACLRWTIWLWNSNKTRIFTSCHIAWYRDPRYTRYKEWLTNCKLYLIALLSFITPALEHLEFSWLHVGFGTNSLLFKFYNNWVNNSVL